MDAPEKLTLFILVTGRDSLSTGNFCLEHPTFLDSGSGCSAHTCNGNVLVLDLGFSNPNLSTRPSFKPFKAFGHVKQQYLLTRTMHSKALAPAETLEGCAQCPDSRGRYPFMKSVLGCFLD